METYFFFDRSLYFGKTASRCAFVMLFRFGYFGYNYFVFRLILVSFFVTFGCVAQNLATLQLLRDRFSTESVHQKRSIQIFEHSPKKNLLMSRFFSLLN